MIDTNSTILLATLIIIILFYLIAESRISIHFKEIYNLRYFQRLYTISGVLSSENKFSIHITYVHLRTLKFELNDMNVYL